MNPSTFAHVVPAIAEEASGPTYSVVRLCESLIEVGRTVTLLALNWAPVLSAPPFFHSFELGLGPRQFGRSPDMMHWLETRARAGEITLLHSHSLWMMPNVYPGRAAARFGIPYVVSPRGTLSAWAMSSGSMAKRLMWPLVQRPALAAVSCFHATSLSEYEDIRRMGFRQPVAVIPNGIDMPPSVDSANDGVRTLLFLGRIHPKKGVDMLLLAWEAVHRRFPEWRLRIVGSDSDGYVGRMRSLANRLGLDRVEFTGPLYGIDKWRAYGEAELFVLPTHSENFGLAVAEALAAGTPTIVSRGAPWGELEVRRAGWWIEIGVDSLVACLETAMSQSRCVLKCMGLRGREWMRKDYSWPGIGLQMAETYRWILGGSDRPSCVIED